MEKSEALITLCRYIATNVKPIVLGHLDGQLKSVWSGQCLQFFQTADVDLNEKPEAWENFHNFSRFHGTFEGKTFYEVLKCTFK